MKEISKTTKEAIDAAISGIHKLIDAQVALETAVLSTVLIEAQVLGADRYRPADRPAQGPFRLIHAEEGCGDLGQRHRGL